MSTYKEALHIGSKAEGTIKAAFAEFFDADGKKCFSLQRKNFTQTETLKSGEVLIAQTGQRTYDFVKAPAGVGAANDLTIDIDIPVCKTYAPASDADKVPVTVTDSAREYIETKILKKVPTYRVWVEYTVYKNGDWLHSERRRECVYEGKTKPTDAQRKAIYDGTAYLFTPTGIIQPGAKVADVLGGLKNAPEGIIDTTLFRRSLWDIGIFTWANILTIPNAQIGQYLRQFGFPMQLYTQDAWNWKTKYEASQEDALIELYSNPQTAAMLERIIKLLGGEVYLDFQIDEEYGTADYSTEQKAIAEMLNSGMTFYVNPDAFDWQETDPQNATIIDEKGIEINLDDYIAECKKKYDQAKAIFAAVSATNLF